MWEKLANKKIRWIIKQLEKGTIVKEIAVMRVNNKKDRPAQKTIRRNRRNSRIKSKQKNSRK